MYSIAENYYNIRQYSEGINSSNTAAGGLDLCFKDDSDIFSFTDIIWLENYAHLKSIFNGISFSHLPVTRENILVQE